MSETQFPHQETADGEDRDEFVRENRDWLKKVADSDRASAWVARAVLQSVPEEGDS